MISDKSKELFEKLQMPYPAIAVKFCFGEPEGVERTDEVLSFCQFVKKAQVENRRFYTTVEDDNCFGKVALGMVPKPPAAASGLGGVAYGVYKTAAPNARLHNTYPTIAADTVRYVVFCPVSMCDFDPDLVICVAEVAQADILMRATSYISGDLWEQKISSVMSCAWMYAYPYISGKVNYCITGMHHGMKRRKVYPPGLFIISIPYSKLLEVVTSLEEMPWALPAMSDDPAVQAELKAKFDKINEMDKKSVFVGHE